jgi:spectinomycin phosphotransferase
MLQKPNLSDDRIISCLREGYGVTATALAFLPIGYDNSAWVYRVATDDGRIYFLKIRKGPIDAVSLAVPRALREAGVARVVAPIPPASGTTPWATVDDYTVVLYPFIEGRNGMEQGLSDPQWVEYGAILRAIHRARLPDELLGRVLRETFVSTWARGVRRLQDKVGRIEAPDPHARELAGFWKEKRDEIERIVARTEDLGRLLRARPFEPVLCHTDPHTGNLLIDADGRLFVVDWDAPLLAPKERDLHFVVGSVIGPTTIGPREEALIFRGYGPTTVDWLALVYYRYEWVCGDLLGFGEPVLDFPDSSDADKEDAIRMTRRMFEPGSSVASADELERRAGRLSGPWDGTA